jgi:hypothetical protein
MNVAHYIVRTDYGANGIAKFKLLNFQKMKINIIPI